LAELAKPGNSLQVLAARARASRWKSFTVSQVLAARAGALRAGL